MALLEDIKALWAEDSKVNRYKLADELVRIPLLHCKYLDILSSTKIKYRKAESDLVRMRAVRWKYFRGEMTREELSEYGWKQFQGTKPIKSEMESLLSGDEELLVFEEKREYLKICLEVVEMIMKDIMQRTYNFRTIQDVVKFEAGG